MVSPTNPPGEQLGLETRRHRPPYELVPRSLALDSRLSLRSRGLLVYMLAKPPGWRFAADRIALEVQEGRDAVRTCLQQLEAAGYLRRTRVRVDGGRMVTVVDVTADPALMPPTTDNQASVDQASVDQPSVNQASKRTQRQTTEREPLQTPSTVVEAAPPAPLRMVEPTRSRVVEAFVDSRFEDWWETYPRRVGKADARKAYTKALRNATSEQLLDGARRYRDDPNREDAYTAHPSTWLNRHGWLDEPLPARPAGSSRAAQGDDVLRRAMMQAQAVEGTAGRELER